MQHNLKNMSLLKDYFNYPGSHKPHSWQYREAKGHTSRNGKCKQPCFLAWTKIGSYVGQQGIHQKNRDTKIALLSDILFRGIFLQPLPSICATLNKLDLSNGSNSLLMLPTPATIISIRSPRVLLHLPVFPHIPRALLSTLS